MKQTSSRKGFTLIELLVVISIIALLAGLAFPALQGALDSAKKAQASTMCTQLATAVTMYNTEYGIWPTTSTTSSTDQLFSAKSDWEDLGKCLNGNRKLSDGSPATSNVSNTRSIQFMSFSKKDLLSGSEAIITPVTKAGTGTTDRFYRLRVDSNYDGTITVPDLTQSSDNDSNSTIAQGVAVWCYGDKTHANNKKLSSYK